VIYVVSFSSLALALLEEVRTPKREKVSIFRACLRVFSAQYFVFHTFSLWKTKVCVRFFNSFFSSFVKENGDFCSDFGCFWISFDVVKMFLRMGNGAT
jgi:hypothetical protein